MSLKNSLIIFFLRLIRTCQKAPCPNKARPAHFLIVSTTALGDTLWATPALSSLRKAYPNATISMLTSPIGSEVLTGSPHIDNLYVMKKPHLLSLLKIFFTLRKRPIDAVFVFHTSQRVVLPFCYLLPTQEIIATEGLNKGLDSLVTQKIKPCYEHEIERRYRLVETYTRAPLQKGALELFITQEDRRAAKEFLKNRNIDPSLPLIGIHPGSKDPFKRWPIECFTQLGQNIYKNTPCTFLITGTPSEKHLTEHLAKELPSAIALTENIPLSHLAALIESCSAFITNDTGPMHVSFAMATPTLALFTATDSALCGPYMAERAVVIQKEITCTPCLKKCCRLPFCMLQISPKEVEEKTLKLLKGTA